VGALRGPATAETRQELSLTVPCGATRWQLSLSAGDDGLALAALAHHGEHPAAGLELRLELVAEEPRGRSRALLRRLTSPGGLIPPTVVPWPGPGRLRLLLGQVPSAGEPAEPHVLDLG